MGEGGQGKVRVLGGAARWAWSHARVTAESVRLGDSEGASMPVYADMIVRAHARVVCAGGDKVLAQGLHIKAHPELTQWEETGLCAFAHWCGCH